jgi:hypothetical protein
MKKTAEGRSLHSDTRASIAYLDEERREISAIDALANDRLLAEHDRLPGIRVHELVFAVPLGHTAIP